MNYNKKTDKIGKWHEQNYNQHKNWAIKKKVVNDRVVKDRADEPHYCPYMVSMIRRPKESSHYLFSTYSSESRVKMETPFAGPEEKRERKKVNFKRRLRWAKRKNNFWEELQMERPNPRSATAAR